MRALVVAVAVAAASLGAPGCAGPRVAPVDTTLARGLDLDGTLALYTALLRDHVHDGLVDYPALAHDPRLPRVLAGLAAVDPDALDRRAAMAFWIDVYNAWMLEVVARNWPVRRVTDLHTGGRVVGYLLRRTVWDHDFVRVGGRRLTLSTVEHRILRARFRDPRVHFALVCAARSCPPLRASAYTPDSLDAQLDDQARRFLRDPRRNRFDLGTRTASISKIFGWFGGDFGGDDAARLRRLARWLPDPVAADIRAHAERWRIRHLPYDWTVNAATAAP